MAKARKMVGLNIEETSGVDHPAHLQEGWLVIKSENSGVDDLLSDLQANQEPDASLLTEETMPQDEKVELAAHTPEEDKKEKMSYGDMEEKLKQMTEELEKTKAELEKTKGKMKKKDDDEVEKEDSVDSLIKSAPEPLRKMLASLEQEKTEALAKAAQTEEVLKSERTTRANAEAIAKAKAWNFLSLDAEKIGPALRQLAEVDADLAKSVVDALTSVNAQAESANIFAEIGKSANPTSGSAYEQLTSMAKSATEGKKGLTFEQAFSDAVTSNPDLYIQYLNEKGAK
jgi:membrane protein involved in colicin uptake